jgi:cytochrome oxidase Cu insertion factor (SCO1/SenC/PrrC family)
MAERKRCQGLNSKCFLVTYLVIVSFLLILWFTRSGLLQEDLRVIPAELSAYITSPSRPIDKVDIILNGKQVLTNNVFGEKWTMVYFSHLNCLPACLQVFNKLAAFQSAYASQDVSVLLISLDTESSALGKLAQGLDEKGFNFQVLEAEDEAVIERLAKTFIALYLKTHLSDGSYQIEQEHHLFLVDPKSRVYAVFDEKTPASIIESSFSAMRGFYAKSE